MYYLLRLENSNGVQSGSSTVIYSQAESTGHLCGRGSSAAHLLPRRSSEFLLYLEYEWAQIEFGPDGRMVAHHVDRYVTRALQRRQSEEGSLRLGTWLFDRCRRCCLRLYLLR